MNKPRHNSSLRFRIRYWYFADIHYIPNKMYSQNICIYWYSFLLNDCTELIPLFLLMIIIIKTKLSLEESINWVILRTSLVQFASLICACVFFFKVGDQGTYGSLKGLAPHEDPRRIKGVTIGHFWRY